MPKFFHAGGLIHNASLRINSGLYAKPRWWDAIIRAPPIPLYPGPVAVNLATPEDRLYMKLVKKRPLLKFEIKFIKPNQPPIAQRFAFRQWRYMNENKLSEEKAYALCDEMFSDEIRAFVERLNFVRAVAADQRDVSSSLIQEVLDDRSRIAKSANSRQAEKQMITLKDALAYFRTKQAAMRSGVVAEKPGPKLAIELIESLKGPEVAKSVVTTDDSRELGAGLRMMQRAIRLAHTRDMIFPKPEKAPLSFDQLIRHFQDKLIPKTPNIDPRIRKIERELEQHYQDPVWRPSMGRKRVAKDLIEGNAEVAVGDEKE